MEQNNGNTSQWEPQARTLLAPLSAHLRDSNPNLATDVLDRVYASISLRDLVDLNTSALLKEHLKSTIGAFGFLIFNSRRRH